MSILERPAWLELRPWLRVERYARDTGVRGARVRLEVERPSDGRVLRRLLALTLPCVACGEPIHVVRERAGRPGLYFAPTCGLDVTFRCSRSKVASREYRAVRAALEAWRSSQATGPPDHKLF